MLRSLLLTTLILLFSVLCQAQTPINDDPIAKALEQAVNRLSVAEEKGKLLEAQIEAKNATIKALEGTINIKDEQLKLTQANRSDQSAIGVLYQDRIVACQEQLSRADARINQLEHPSFFKQLFSPQTLSGVVIGYGAGRLAK